MKACTILQCFYRHLAPYYNDRTVHVEQAQQPTVVQERMPFLDGLHSQDRAFATADYTRLVLSAADQLVASTLLFVAAPSQTIVAETPGLHLS